MKPLSFLPPTFMRYDFPILMKMLLPAVFVTITAFTFNEFVMNSVRANTVLNFGIVLAASYGFTLIYLRLLGLQCDMRALIRFNHEVRAGKNMKELLAHKWIQNSAIRHYIEPIAQTEGKLSSQLDQNAIKHELEALSDEYDSKIELPQFLVGFMIALGLLGTFIGLLTTLTGISGMLEGMGGHGDIEKEFAKLVSELRQPLAGMGIAFSSSMFGLVFSLMLAIMMTMLRRYMSRVMEKARTVMNQVTTRVEFSAVESSVNNDAPQEVQAGASNRDISIQMVNSINLLVKRMDGVAKSLDRSIDGTRKTNELLGFGPRLRETSEQMLQEIRSFASHHEENQKTLRKVISGLIQIEQALMANSTQDLLAAQKETISKTGDVFSSIQTLTNITGSVLEAQRESGNDISHAMRESSDHIVQEVKAVSSLQGDGQKLFQKVVHSLVQIDQALLANSPRELVMAQQETIAKLNDIFVATQTQSRMSGSILEAQKEGDSETAQLLKTIQERFVRIEDVNVGASRHLEEIKTEVSRASDALSSVEDISDNVGRQTVLLEASQDRAREDMSYLFEGLNQKLGALVARVTMVDGDDTQAAVVASQNLDQEQDGVDVEQELDGHEIIDDPTKV